MLLIAVMSQEKKTLKLFCEIMFCSYTVLQPCKRRLQRKGFGLQFVKQENR